jgi:hypothetical protein
MMRSPKFRESVQLHPPDKARTAISVDTKPNPKRCNAWFRDTSTLGGSVAADAALVAWL